jgi:hypothetical protein
MVPHTLAPTETQRTVRVAAMSQIRRVVPANGNVWTVFIVRGSSLLMVLSMLAVQIPPAPNATDPGFEAERSRLRTICSV